jgi:hypothetical protein
MAHDSTLNCITVAANADLSAAQYRFVKLVNSSGEARAARADLNSRVIGVLQNDPAVAGYAATVAIGGISKVVAGDAITAGVAVTTDSAGRAVPVASADAFEVGIAMVTAAAAGDIIPVLLHPAGIT